MTGMSIGGFGVGAMGGLVGPAGPILQGLGKSGLGPVNDALRTGKGPRGGKDYVCTVLSPSMNGEEQYRNTVLWADHGFAWLIALHIWFRSR